MTRFLSSNNVTMGWRRPVGVETGWSVALSDPPEQGSHDP